IQRTPLLFSLCAPSPSDVYILSLHDALPICWRNAANNKHGNYSRGSWICVRRSYRRTRQNERYLHNWCGAGDYSYLAPYHNWPRSEEHTSELQSLAYLVCRLLLEKKKNTK